MLRYQGDLSPITFYLIDASDHITGKTGLTPTVTISKAGGAFAAPAGSVAEIGNGAYKLTPATADVNTTGELLLHATAAGADPVDERRFVLVDPERANGPLDTVRQRVGGFLADAAGTLTVGAVTAVKGAVETAGGFLDLVKTRVVAAFSVGGVLADKTGFALTAPYDPAKTAAQPGDVTAARDAILTGQTTLATNQATINTNVTAVGVAVTGLATTVGAGVTLTSTERTAIADAYLDHADAIATGLSPRMAMRWLHVTAGAGGKLSGYGPSTGSAQTGTFRAAKDTADAGTVTADDNGNRVGVAPNLVVLADGTKW